jgi:hypothetical protein
VAEKKALPSLAELENIIGSLTDETFREFLAQQGSTLKCELCGSTDFGLNIKQNTHDAIITMRRVEGGVGKKRELELPAIMATCLNCTNAKFFLKHSIALLIHRKNEGQNNAN